MNKTEPACFYVGQRKRPKKALELLVSAVEKSAYNRDGHLSLNEEMALLDAKATLHEPSEGDDGA